MINYSFVIYAEILLLAIVVVFVLDIKPNLIRFQKYFIVIFILLPILFFFFNVIISTDNIPFKDDYVLLDSILQMKTADSFSVWLSAFLKQVNQHRFGFERTMMWLIYKVFGSENIKAQILIGDLFLLGILYFFIKIFRGFQLSWLYFIPISLLLFNYSYFENATWGIAAIQNTPIIFFALLCIYLLISRTPKNFYLAILVAIITMFTSGNGLGIWVVGLLLLSTQLRWKELLIWTLVAGGVIYFYFQYDYDFIQSDKANLWTHPFLNLFYLLAFWGNVFFANVPHPLGNYRYLDILLCMSTGVFLTLMMVGIVWKIWQVRLQKNNTHLWFLLAGMCFLAMTGLMLVVSRPVEIKVYSGGDLLSRRYMIFGAIFLGFGYLSYLSLFKNHKYFLRLIIIVALPLSLGLNIYSYYTSIPDVYRQQQELKLDGHYWKKDTMLLTFGERYKEKMGYNHPTYMINLINRLDSSGIYKLSQTEVSPIVDVIKKRNKTTSEKFTGTVDTTKSQAMTIAREWKERIMFKVKSNGKYISYFAFKSQQNVFLLPAVPVQNNFKKCILSQSYYDSDFLYEIWKAKYPADDYEFWVIEKDEIGNLNPLFSGKNIRLD
jgi:hypothetical protein